MAKGKEVVREKKSEDRGKEADKSRQLFHARCLILILAIGTHAEMISMVSSLRNSGEGEIVLYSTSGVVHRYVMVRTLRTEVPNVHLDLNVPW